MASRPLYRWNKKAASYIRANGRFVSRAEIQRAIDGAVAREVKKVAALAAKLRNGDVSLEAWRLEMRATIKNVHLFAAAAAKGGWAQLDQADYGRVGGIVRQEYGYLEKRARAIASGAQALDGSFVERAKMYAEAGTKTFSAVQRGVMARAGFRWERNVLHRGEHCAGCLAESARGWVKNGRLVPIGSRDCLSRCNCTIEFSKTKPSE